MANVKMVAKSLEGVLKFVKKNRIFLIKGFVLKKFSLFNNKSSFFFLNLHGPDDKYDCLGAFTFSFIIP
jgi:hypothetical protein